MVKSRWILLSALVSFSAWGEVSFDEKKNRVEYLEGLNAKAVSMNIEAYRRELEYEKQNLPLDTRAENEANLLAEKIKVQVQEAYEEALKNKTPNDAYLEVKEAIEKDLKLVSPELQDEIREISLNSLESAQHGGMSSEGDLNDLKGMMLKGVEERVSFLNEEAEPMPQIAKMVMGPDKILGPDGDGDPDAEREEYDSKSELLASLVSDGENTQWVSTSNQNISSEALTSADSKIGIQLKVQFLGIAIEAGPTINFKRTYSTKVDVMAEGLNPILQNDGNFDFIKRDKQGRAVLKRGKTQRRFVVFTCEGSLNFEAEYAGSGGFSIAGIGASTSVARSYENKATLTSRRVFVPGVVARRTVTLNYLKELCHMDFLKARVTNNMNVAGSLNVLMKNVLSSLVFSHPKTTCAVTSHCYNWFNKELSSIAKRGTFPRCVEHRVEKYRFCELRALKNQSCPVYEKGKRTSSGVMERYCDVGLRCVKTQNAGWITPSKGKCVPVNSRTYVDPFEQIRRSKR